MDCTYIQIGSRTFRTKASSLLKVQNEQVGGSDEKFKPPDHAARTLLQKPFEKPTLDDYFEAIKQNINLLVIPLMKVSSIMSKSANLPSEKLNRIYNLQLGEVPGKVPSADSSIKLFKNELYDVLRLCPKKPSNTTEIGLVDNALDYIKKKKENAENAHLLWGGADSAATNEFVTFIRQLIVVLFLSKSSEDVIQLRLPIDGVLEQLEYAYLESKPYKDSTRAGPNKVEKIPPTKKKIHDSYGTFKADDYYLAYPVLIGDKHLHFGTIFEPLDVERQFQMVGSVTSFNVLESLSVFGEGGGEHIIHKDGFSFFVVRYVVRHRRTTDGPVIAETLYGHVTFSYPSGKRPGDLHSICNEDFYLNLLKDVDELNARISWGKEKHSLLLPYYKKASIGPTTHEDGLLYTPSVKPSVSMTFDLDDTLLHTDKHLPYFREKYIKKKENGEEEENLEWLRDPELIKLSTLLPNAKALKDMFIPFRIITSRRDLRLEDWRKGEHNPSPEPVFLARAIKEKEGFAPETVVTDVSFGHQIKGDDREKKKADDKYTRFLSFHNSTAPSGPADIVGGRWAEKQIPIHFDDDPIVVGVFQENGVLSVLVDKTDPSITTCGGVGDAVNEIIKPCFGIRAPVGFGKSTLFAMLSKSKAFENYNTLAVDDYPSMGDNNNPYQTIQSIIRRKKRTTPGFFVDTTFSSLRDVDELMGKSFFIVELTTGNIFTDLLFSVRGLFGRSSHTNLKPPRWIVPLGEDGNSPDYDDARPLLDIFNTTGDDTTDITNALRSKHVTVTPLNVVGLSGKYNLVKVKYLEHAQNFRDKCMRESRNSILVWVENENKWVYFSNQFIRGAESLSVLTKKFQTENMTSEKDVLNFAGPQQLVMNALCTENTVSMEGCLSFKADGQLIGITCVNKDSVQSVLVKDIYSKTPDKFLQLVHSILESLEFKDWNYIPLIRSNGTLFISDKSDMYRTLITSLVRDDAIDSLLGSEDAIAKHYITKLLRQCRNATGVSEKELGLNNIICLSFEAICKDRKYHPMFKDSRIIGELAVKYNESSLRFLGFTYGDGNKFPSYMCHGDTRCRSIVTMSGFDEPLFVTINSNQEIVDYTKHLGLVINGEMTEDAFIDKIPFGNKTRFGVGQVGNTPVSGQPLSGRLPYRPIIDPEGWVYITTDGEYCKIKTPEYYMYHKLKYANMQMIVNAPPAVGRYFPIAESINTELRVHLPTKLTKVLIGLYKMWETTFSDIRTFVMLANQTTLDDEYLKEKTNRAESYDKRTVELSGNIAIINTLQEEFSARKNALDDDGKIKFVPEKATDFGNLDERMKKACGELHTHIITDCLDEKKEYSFYIGKMKGNDNSRLLCLSLGRVAFDALKPLVMKEEQNLVACVVRFSSSHAVLSKIITTLLKEHNVQIPYIQDLTESVSGSVTSDAQKEAERKTQKEVDKAVSTVRSFYLEVLKELDSVPNKRGKSDMADMADLSVQSVENKIGKYVTTVHEALILNGIFKPREESAVAKALGKKADKNAKKPENPFWDLWAIGVGGCSIK